MANFNINDLPAVSSLGDADLFESEQGGVNKKATGSQLKTYLLATSILWVGNIALSSNTLPTTGGSGTAGAILKGNMFYNTAASTSLLAPDGASLIPAGTWVIALQDNPTLITHFAFVTTIL